MSIVVIDPHATQEQQHHYALLFYGNTAKKYISHYNVMSFACISVVVQRLICAVHTDKKFSSWTYLV